MTYLLLHADCLVWNGAIKMGWMLDDYVIQSARGANRRSGMPCM